VAGVNRAIQALLSRIPDGGQKVMAAELEVSPSHLSRVLRDEKVAGLSMRRAARDRYGIPLQWWDEPSLPSAAPELIDASLDEVTPAEVPAAKRQSSAPPPPAARELDDEQFQAQSREHFDRVLIANLTDAAAVDDDTVPSELPSSTPSNLPPVTTAGRTRRNREDTDPQDPSEIELPPHVEAHPELRPGERVTEIDEDDRTPTPDPAGGF
jgi:transcriptional regulator with XRE-family HTH domain